MRKRDKQSSKDAAQNSDKHSVMENNVHFFCIFFKNTEDFTLKQMFHISENLVSEQDEIHGVETMNWESSSLKSIFLTS